MTILTRTTALPRLLAVLGGTALAGAAAVALALPAGAATATGATGTTGGTGTTGATGTGGEAGAAVYVQTDNPVGNQVVVYHRAGDGTLTPAGSHATGGLGGVLAGSVVDHLASQGSLGYDQPDGLLFAVNAGSDSVSAFAAHGDRLALRQVLGSGGSFPVSVTVHGNLVYVLNALDGGSVQGFRLEDGLLHAIPGSHRPLGLDPTATPQFTHTPGQVAFSPDGSQLIVTTKANGNDIDVFAVGPNGRPSAAPVVNAEPGTVPFAIAFDPAGNLVIANAGNNSLASFRLTADGRVSLLDSVGTGQAATCWVAPAGRFLYTSNAGSATLSGFGSGRSGTLALLGQTGTDPGTVDATAAAGGAFLYVQTGATGTVDEFAVGATGGLTRIGSVLVPGAVGGEGIAAG